MFSISLFGVHLYCLLSFLCCCCCCCRPCYHFFSFFSMRERKKKRKRENHIIIYIFSFLFSYYFANKLLKRSLSLSFSFHNRIFFFFTNQKEDTCFRNRMRHDDSFSYKPISLDLLFLSLSLSNLE